MSQQQIAEQTAALVSKIQTRVNLATHELHSMEAYKTGLTEAFRKKARKEGFNYIKNGSDFKAEAYVVPEKAEIERFKENNQEGLSKINNSIKSFNIQDDNEVAKIMMRINDKSEINNSAFDPISPRSIVIPNLLRPTFADLGYYYDSNEKGDAVQKDITINDYIGEHPVTQGIGIDIGYRSLVIADWQMTGDFTTARQSNELPSMLTDINQQEKIGQTNTIEAKLFTQASMLSVDPIEAATMKVSTQFNMPDPYIETFKEMKRIAQLKVQIDVLVGNGGTSDFSSFAKQYNETGSDALFNGLWTSGQTDIFLSLTDANFLTAMKRLAQEIQNREVKRPRYKYDRLITCDSFMNQYGNLNRLNILETYLRRTLGRPNFKVLPADFYIPNNSTTMTGGQLVGKNPFGNKAVAMLYASNNQSDIQYLYKTPVAASLGNIEYVDFIGTQIAHSMTCYSEPKAINADSRIIITNP